MKVNNIDISKFNAKQLTVDIQASSIEVENDWLDKSLTPIYLATKIKYKPISIVLYLRGKGRDDILNNISNILSLMKNKCVLDLDGYRNSYVSCLTEHEAEKTIRKDRYKLNLKFSAYEIGDEVTEAINRILSKSINVKGNSATPCVVEITPSTDLIEFNIQGLANDPIIIKNLKKGKKIIFNGEEGTVLEEGNNKYLDTDFWEFPFLLPGTNIVTLSKNNCDIKIKYKPRYI